VLEEVRVLVEPDDLSCHTDTSAERPGDAARAAPEIETSPAFAHADEIEHDLDIARERRALDVQALDLAGAAFNRVAA
jgi:hypothetical protein